MLFDKPGLVILDELVYLRIDKKAPICSSKSSAGATSVARTGLLTINFTPPLTQTPRPSSSHRMSWDFTSEISQFSLIQIAEVTMLLKSSMRSGKMCAIDSQSQHFSNAATICQPPLRPPTIPRPDPPTGSTAVVLS